MSIRGDEPLSDGSGPGPVSSGAGMQWLSTDHGGGLALGVFGALPSRASEAGH